MRNYLRIWSLTLLLVAGTWGLALAAFKVETTQTQQLPKAALDVAITADGSRLFVLLKGGEVQMLTSAGNLLERFSVPATAERLTVAPEGDRLFILAGQELHTVDISTLHEMPVLNSPAKGPDHAPVTFTVFSDFQCPYCARLLPFLEEVLAKNPETVRVVFKQFPLRMHNMAQPAALASLAAREQGKFWSMHDKLFANFSQLSEEKFKALAQEAGLDMNRFNADRASQKLKDELQRDLALGQQVGVQGTPSVFINGKLLRDRSAPAVQALIDREVARVKGAGK